MRTTAIGITRANGSTAPIFGKSHATAAGTSMGKICYSMRRMDSARLLPIRFARNWIKAVETYLSSDRDLHSNRIVDAITYRAIEYY